MVIRIKFLAILLMAGLTTLQVSADTYAWNENHHVCSVQSAKATSVDGSSFGDWPNPPEGFSLSIMNCEDFLVDAIASGLPFSWGEHVRVCEEVDPVSRAHYDVIFVDGLDVGYFEPRPLATYQYGMFGALAVNSNGTLDYITRSVREQENGQRAWLSLRAKCEIQNSLK